MTNLTLQAVQQLIANDSYAVTFQSVEQYRTALLRHVDSLMEGPTKLPGAASAESQGERDMFENDVLDLFDGNANFQRNGGSEYLNTQVLDMWVGWSMRAAHTPAVAFANDGREPDWQGYAEAERAQQAAAPGALLAILRDVHDTLSSESDSDIDDFESDDEEREGAPVQYAARKVMEVMDMLKAAPSAPGTPEAPKGGAA